MHAVVAILASVSSCCKNSDSDSAVQSAYVSASVELSATVACVREQCCTVHPSSCVSAPVVLLRVTLHPAQSESENVISSSLVGSCDS